MPLTVLLLLLPGVGGGADKPIHEEIRRSILLPQQEETPTAASEKINFTMDGKWSSVSFPVDDNGTPARCR